MMISALSVPPSDTEVDAWRAVLADVRTADLPQLPEPSRAEVAGRLQVPPTRGRTVHWAAADGTGVAGLILFTEEGNTHTAFLDVLAVRPQARRRGVGAALWERVREELLAQGRTSVSTLIDLGGPGQAFAESLGFENVLPVTWWVQDVAEREPAEIPATPGYELKVWHGLVPDEWADAAAVAHAAMEDAPAGDSDEQFTAWTAERVHTAQQLVLDRGGELTMVAAVTPAGEVAAYTVLVLPDPAGPRALQYDTVVVPAHRGHGLGRAVKLGMLADAARRHPALRQIGTTVADENTPMRAVNDALGYRRERGAAVFQLRLKD
ncbi:MULTISPECIES: GNAT family N-acetyltransferase [unclassified Streptomyces]|uniref:GNAT family N-acetyltransferase n=1 Tax=unclassified Streptomyces TaxID=2593676 RepID=UPI001BE58B28|nr:MULTISPECIES: GNAT family N-acetyltransferase [unclassified Streptomyces]MBT2408033.1 GNAT family N-acetyltransferase [Streptomyces sp. ISL-21]MBT2611383.1 GNAT family N-acetyltransferase [Streptomyces sp. ISL-87]